MSCEDEDEQAWAALVGEALPAWIAERTGVSRAVIDRILEAQAQYWAERPEFLSQALDDDE